MIVWDLVYNFTEHDFRISFEESYCMIASDTLFDSRGWVFGVKLVEENIVVIECLTVVAMATNCGTKIAITGFVRTIVTRQLVMEGV